MVGEGAGKLLFWGCLLFQCRKGRPQLRVGVGTVDKEDGGSGESSRESAGAVMLRSESPSS